MFPRPHFFVVSGEELESISEDGRLRVEVGAGGNVSRQHVAQRVQLEPI
jgi:hypothetical protein